MHQKRNQMRSGLALAGAVALAATATPVSAHHALEALFDTSTELETKATLLRVDWINPHAWMRFDITTASGVVEKNVLMETLGIGSLRQLGIQRDLLKEGTVYQISYYPNRNGTPGGFMTRMLMPDGRPIGPSVYEPGDF
jgi:hypothetical protein